MAAPQALLVDVLTPTFNEESSVKSCYEAIRQVFDDRPHLTYRHTFIDNASTDTTVQVILGLIGEDRNVRLIENAVNFGAEKSGYHGILQLDGDLFSVVLCDLQTPAETLATMLDSWDPSFDAILALKETRSARGLDRARHFYYRLMSRLSDGQHLHGFLGYGLYSARVTECLRSIPDSNPYFRGLVVNLGLRYKTVTYQQAERRFGESHHSLADLFDYFFLGLVASSTKALKWAVVLGAFIGFISALLGLSYAVVKILWWEQIPLGIGPLLIGTFGLGGLILSLLGLVGLYVAKTLDQVSGRPLVFERARHNFD